MLSFVLTSSSGATSLERSVLLTENPYAPYKHPLRDKEAINIDPLQSLSKASVKVTRE